MWRFQDDTWISVEKLIKANESVPDAFVQDETRGGGIASRTASDSSVAVATRWADSKTFNPITGLGMKATAIACLPRFNSSRRFLSK